MRLPHPVPVLLVLCSGLTAAELAPSADIGALPMISPREWALLNYTPDDNTVSAQVPRRREIDIGVSRLVVPEQGIGVHIEGVWSPVRARLALPPSRVDEVILGAGVSLERPMGEGRFGWRLAGTVGVRLLGDLGTSEIDRAEHRLLHNDPYHSEGRPEHPDSVDLVGALSFTSRVRLFESDPLRKAPLDLAFSFRAMRYQPTDGDRSGVAEPDMRAEMLLQMPTRTTVSWLGLTWQGLSQSGGSHATGEMEDAESGWWFASGGALRLGEKGDWLIEVGSGFDLRTGVAVGTLGFVHSGDPPHATADGTASLSLVTLPGDHMASGMATGDELKRYGPMVVRSEIRTLIGRQDAVPASDRADAVRLDGLLRAQLPWVILPNLAIGPEAAFGLGLRRDAAVFGAGTVSAVQRIEVTGDVGMAARFSTGWKDGIAAVEGSLGWSRWQAIGGAHDLTGNGESVPLDRGGSSPIIRVGLLAKF